MSKLSFVVTTTPSAQNPFTPDLFELIQAGNVTAFFMPLSEQPPELFRSGDVAGITNGPQWTISKMPDRKCWHPGREPGIECPFGHKFKLPSIEVTHGAETLHLAVTRTFLEQLSQLHEFEVAPLGFTGPHPLEAFQKSWDARNAADHSVGSGAWGWMVQFQKSDPPL